MLIFCTYLKNEVHILSSHIHLQVMDAKDLGGLAKQRFLFLDQINNKITTKVFIHVRQKLLKQYCNKLTVIYN